MRYKVTVSYQGSAYQGWQTQHKNNSVQEEIEAVLKIIHKKDVEIVASGRTDAKVHALGQVFHFDTQLDIDAQGIKNALNALLSKRIRIKKVEQVNDDFHARFHAVSKRYDYYISNDMENPFIVDYMGIEEYPLDISLMCDCAQLFFGTHDFTSFTSARIDERKSRVKTITRIEVKQEDNAIHLIFEGNGFLRYMVRMLAQTLIEGGKQRVTKEEVKSMLDSKCKHACKYKADPRGLYLVSVTY